MAKKQDSTNILYLIIGALVIFLVWFIVYSSVEKWIGETKDTPLIIEAWNMWIDKNDLKACIASDKYLDKINSQNKIGADSFGITWTPWNVLINNISWEYEIISWAYPKEDFIVIIDRLLSDEKATDNKVEESKEFVVNADESIITIITDRRDSVTPTDQIVWNLKQIVWTKDMEIINYDFSDNGVSEYLKENKITTLPAIIFAKDEVDENINNFLVELEDDKYSLSIWSTFNPFGKMSPKWFKVVDKALIEQIKKDSYIDWNKDAQITWLEYSDLECQYCARLHNSDVESSLKEKYGDKLNLIFNHFPLAFHKKAKSWAEILECVWEQGWTEAFYKIMRFAFKNEIQE
jgi:protein-disulfide isomerase